jgi:hypothetical protein
METTRFCIVGVVLLLTGCFNPHYGSPSFYCHEDDQPACPDGQYCVAGRCVDPGKVTTDGGVVPIEDMSGGPRADLAPPSSNPNPSPSPNPNPGTNPTPNPGPGSSMTGCNGYSLCLSSCFDPTCQMACDANVTAQGLQLEQEAESCGEMWCLDSGDCAPDATGTMLVDGQNGVGSCDACLNDALADLFGTMCSSPYGANCNPSSCTFATSACLADLP